MGITIQIKTHSDVLHVLAEGEFTIESAETTFRQIVKAVVAGQNGKIFFDGRKVTGDPSFIERFIYGEFTANTVAHEVEAGRLSRPPKFAYVLSKPVLDEGRLGEMVATNRGLNVKAFDDMGRAIEWLDIPHSVLED